MDLRHQSSCAIAVSMINKTSKGAYARGSRTRTRNGQRTGGDEQNGQLVPQAKRLSRAHPLSPEPGRDAGDIEREQWDQQPRAPGGKLAAASTPWTPWPARESRGPAAPLGSLVDSSASELAGPTTLLSYHQITAT
ncbi:hypothetical protein N1851_009058 [Merluccius polli]|uniref:Uncharacterized protein n=1 Tax=Merluccius polli TaxID=89951 RepID=A0AA47N0M0_MERPO|nr:hypothetical protein N1851_009058 [Merluccius polli]